MHARPRPRSTCRLAPDRGARRQCLRDGGPRTHQTAAGPPHRPRLRRLGGGDGDRAARRGGGRRQGADRFRDRAGPPCGDHGEHPLRVDGPVLRAVGRGGRGRPGLPDVVARPGGVDPAGRRLCGRGGRGRTGRHDRRLGVRLAAAAAPRLAGGRGRAGGPGGERGGRPARHGRLDAPHRAAGLHRRRRLHLRHLRSRHGLRPQPPQPGRTLRHAAGGLGPHRGPAR